MKTTGKDDLMMEKGINNVDIPQFQDLCALRIF